MPGLFDSLELGSIELPNRVVMAPLTRARAGFEAVPNELMAAYYSQRAGAGLIITEGNFISRDAAGYIHVPGLFTPEQTEGWRAVTKAVHDQGGKIFAQIAHCGAVSHRDFHAGLAPLAPSAVNPLEMTFTPGQSVGRS